VCSVVCRGSEVVECLPRGFSSPRLAATLEYEGDKMPSFRGARAVRGGAEVLCSEGQKMPTGEGVYLPPVSHWLKEVCIKDQRGVQWQPEVRVQVRCSRCRGQQCVQCRWVAGE